MNGSVSPAQNTPQPRVSSAPSAGIGRTMAKIVYCCDSWKKAINEGTDTDGYGPLIQDHRRMYGIFYGPSIGMNLPDIQFCPWCGDKKQ